MKATIKLLDPNSEIPSKGNGSPPQLFIITLGGIFLAEVIAMIVVYFVRPEQYWLQTLLDAGIMVIMIFPVVYYFSYRILIRQIEVRKRSQALLFNVLESMPVGVWITDENGNILYGNPASQELWTGECEVGVDHSDEYKGWWADSGKRIETEEWSAVRAVRTGERILDEEIEIECFDGTRKFILNSSVPIHKDGEIQGAIVINQDITELKDYTRELVHANELLNGVFNSVDIMIAYLDRNFNFIQVNDAYAKFSGYSAEFLIGKNHFELFPHEENLSIFKRVVETGEPYVAMEKPFEYPDHPERGVTYWDWSLQPVRSIDRTIVGVVLSLVDVTERARAEILLEHQNQELRELYNSESKTRQATETLVTAAGALAKTLDQTEILQTLMEHIDKIIPSDLSGLGLLDTDERLIVPLASGYSEWIGSDHVYNFPSQGSTDGYLRQMITSRQHMLIADTAADPLFVVKPGTEHIRNWLLVPIIAHENAIGLVALGKVEPNFYTPEYVQWVAALVSQAAIAIQNAWLFEQVRASSERLQSLTRKLVDIQERERVYISRELHDDAGQALTSIILGLGRLEQTSDCPEGVRDRLRELKILADAVMENLHNLAMNLRPASLDQLGLVHALEQHAKTIQSNCLSVEFKALGFDEVRLPPTVETALYRITQEALTNVVRHSKAGTVGILLERHAGIVILYVEDDGIGFDPDAVNARRMGLVGMRERAELIGGVLSVESTPGGGTSIRVEVADAIENFNRR